MNDEVTYEDEIEVGGDSPYKNCAALQDYYETAGVAYDSNLKAGVKCE